MPTSSLQRPVLLPITTRRAKSRFSGGKDRNMTPAPADTAERRDFLHTNIAPLLLSLVGVALVTALLLLLKEAVAASLVPIAYLVPVLIAATRWGIRPATLASIASMAVADFFFFPPLYSFQVDDPQAAVDLLLFFVVALVASNLASRLRQETETLRRREQDIHNLYDFSRRLAACFTVPELVSAIENYLSQTLGRPAVFFAAKNDGHLEPARSGSVPQVVKDHAVSAVTTGRPDRPVNDMATQDVWLLRMVSSETATLGLVAVN